MFRRVNVCCQFHFCKINLLTGLCKSTCVCLLISLSPPVSLPAVLPAALPAAPSGLCTSLYFLPPWQTTIQSMNGLEQIKARHGAVWDGYQGEVDNSSIDTGHFLGILDASHRTGMIVIGGLAWKRSQRIAWYWTMYVLPSLYSLTILIFLSNRLMVTPHLIGHTVGGGHGPPRWLQRWASDDLEPSQVAASHLQHNTIVGRLSRL